MAPAQTVITPDPMASLLLSQPQIDTTAPVVATATFDPPIIHAGSSTTYRVTFNAMLDSINWPDDVIAPESLRMVPGGRGQLVLPTGTNLQPHTTFNTRTTAAEAGTFTVPRYIVYVYGRPVTVPPAQLVVVSDPTVRLPSAPAVRLEFSTTNAFVGQPLSAKVVMEGETNGIVQALSGIKFTGEGFIADQTFPRQRVQPTQPGSDGRPAFIYEVDLTPITAGPITIAAQGFTAGNQFAGPITITGRVTIPGGPPRYTLLDTDPVTLNVRPLPQEGRLPGFAGAIGTFRVGSPNLSTNVVKVGDPVDYTVRIQGEGNLARLVPPPPPELDGWKVFAGQQDPAPPQLVHARGFINFHFTLIPTTDEARATPVIPFSYFDPQTETYQELNLPALPLRVTPSPFPSRANELAEADQAAPTREPEPALSAPATRPGRAVSRLQPLQSRSWFPSLQIAPALLFAGLWWWDRRRRFLEAHPEIIARRRARRALRREWSALRQAASHGDTSRFATCAVNAMRAAGAPHYPAEPRALVSTDILPLLPAADETAHNAVRAVFATANAERFAATPAIAKNLLALRADVDRALSQLEARL